MNEWMNDSISHSFGKECLKFNSSNSGVEFVRLKSWHVEKKDKSCVCVYIYWSWSVMIVFARSSWAINWILAEEAQA